MEDSNDKFPKFKEVWAACDTNKDGSVNEDEAKNCLKASGMPKKAMKMAAKFMIKAAGKDEKLSEKEFGAAYRNFKNWAKKMIAKHGEKKNVEIEEEADKFPKF